MFIIRIVNACLLFATPKHNIWFDFKRVFFNLTLSGRLWFSIKNVCEKFAVFEKFWIKIFESFVSKKFFIVFVVKSCCWQVEHWHCFNWLKVHSFFSNKIWFKFWVVILNDEWEMQRTIRRNSDVNFDHSAYNKQYNNESKNILNIF